MNYQQTLDYLFKQLPMYQRVGSAAYKSDLNNTIELCKILDNPELKFKSIHIAGTNGKGSTSHMIASILQESGYKVGLYTSPHLKDFRERIKINGEMIREQDVISFVENYQNKFEAIQLSFFEWTVGLAFDYFAKNNVDIAVIETGLGGRLDSTNVIIPEVSVITNIGLDHTQFLGNTIEKIAVEKAGIIKKGIPVVIGERQEEIKHIFHERALELSTSLLFASDSDIQLKTDLKGNYQKSNIKTAVSSINILQEQGWEVPKSSIQQGLKNVVKNTGLLGRWQTLQYNPQIICDTGHNEDGIKIIVNQLRETEYENLHFVLGMVNDKDISNVLSLLPKDAKYYFCKANIPRALDAYELKISANKIGLEGESFPSVLEALRGAKNTAKENDLIFIGGSTFVGAEAL